MSPRLELVGIAAGYRDPLRGERAVLRDVSLSIAPGEVVGLVGPNGAGKSTLLRVAAGTLAPSRGAVRLDGRPLAELSRREIAQRIAWLPQSQDTDLAFTAREIVAMGRLPHLGPYTPAGAADREAIESALDATQARALETRAFPTLSEGEKQRVLLARSLAQTPTVLLLDEPTASLDVRHAWALMRLVREKAKDGLAVLAAVHDLALAARACDRVVVIAGGAVVRDGAPHEALDEDTIARTFGMRARVAREDGRVVLTILGASDER